MEKTVEWVLDMIGFGLIMLRRTTFLDSRHIMRTKQHRKMADTWKASDERVGQQRPGSRL